MSNNILAQIVEHKKQELTTRKQQKPLTFFIEQLKPSNRSLKKALSHNYSDFIMEVKKASPSKGLIREDFDLDEILKQYQKYASAVSVLTDKKYFQGSFDYLKKASETITQPILCKDFFIDIYQVYEARFYGADAILLMLSVLDDKTYLELAKVAGQFQLDILTEVHDEYELERAINLDAKIIGINNRNLKDLSIDLATTEKLADKIPSDRIVISESGISTYQDVKRLSPKVNAFLVGSSLMIENDLESQCKELLFGRVKICGITQIEDAQSVSLNGGSYAGFIFYNKSKRYIKPEKAKQIIGTVKLKYVGVFVNQPSSSLIEIVKELGLHVIQLHGDESEEYIAVIKQALPNIKIWKAIHIVNSIEFKRNSLIDCYLLDTYSNEALGGTGKTFDWNLLNDINLEDIILAGGINADNIQQANQLNPYALDLSSSVELSPGIKSADKIKQIFKLIRA